MADRMTPLQRHVNMAAIHGKDTKPEIIVRRYLWHHGFRFRLNHRRLPGKPDVVLRMYRTCIFVNGCFWHGHHIDFGKECEVQDVKNSECCKIPNTRRDYWVAKIERNQKRDAEVIEQLKSMGWNCITIWECELKTGKRQKTLQSLVHTLNTIWLDNHKVKRYELKEMPMPMAADES